MTGAKHLINGTFAEEEIAEARMTNDTKEILLGGSKLKMGSEGLEDGIFNHNISAQGLHNGRWGVWDVLISHAGAWRYWDGTL